MQPGQLKENSNGRQVPAQVDWIKDMELLLDQEVPFILLAVMTMK